MTPLLNQQNSVQSEEDERWRVRKERERERGVMEGSEWEGKEKMNSRYKEGKDEKVRMRMTLIRKTWGEKRERRGKKTRGREIQGQKM